MFWDVCEWLCYIEPQPFALGLATADDPHKFAGMYLDGESTLYQTWARMYSPQYGRWLKVGPATVGAPLLKVSFLRPRPFA